MKKIHLIAGSLLFAAMCITGTSCDKQDSTAPTATKPAAKSEKAEAALPNYRYVDGDTLLAKYHLAKDYSDEMIRMQTNMEAQAKKHRTELESKATKMQNKLQNNGYLSEASYNADQKELAALDDRARKSLANLQASYENSAMQGQKAVNDSIEAFIKEYAKKRGYDAIFFKGSTLYINSALDITDEVVEGLNARYNKVKK